MYILVYVHSFSGRVQNALIFVYIYMYTSKYVSRVHATGSGSVHETLSCSSLRQRAQLGRVHDYTLLPYIRLDGDASLSKIGAARKFTRLDPRTRIQTTAKAQGCICSSRALTGNTAALPPPDIHHRSPASAVLVKTRSWAPRLLGPRINLSLHTTDEHVDFRTWVMKVRSGKNGEQGRAVPTKGWECAG